MARKPKSEFLSGAGTAYEILKAISDAVRGKGGDDDDLRRLLSDKDLAREVASVIVGRRGEQFPSLRLAGELIPDGWEIVPGEDVAPSNFDVAKLRPRPFLKGGETSCGGDEMRRRAVGVGGNLGLADGKRILAEQEKLSVEFQGSYIPLPGNVLRGPHGDLYVAYLRFVGGRWILSFNWLDNDWGGDGLFACSE